MTVTTKYPPNVSALQIDGQAELWRTFINAPNAAVFQQAWLALLCRQLSGIKLGILLLSSEKTDTFLPAAVWPNTGRDLSMFGNVVKQALTEGRGIVQKASDTPDADLHVAFPIELSKRLLGAVVVEASARSDADTQLLLKQLHWGSAWLYRDNQQKNITAQDEKLERLGSVMEIIATALRQKELQETLFDVANQVARYQHCSRVSIGLVHSATIQVMALSNTAWFEKNTSTIKLTAAAMNECYDRLTPVQYTSTEKQKTRATTAAVAHEQLAQETKAKHIYSQPLMSGTECQGVITLERNSDKPFLPADYTWLEALASILPGAIYQKQLAERGLLRHSADGFRLLLSRLFGPKYLIWKFSASVLLVAISCLVFIRMDYRVSANAVIEGEIQRAMAAPFDGFIASTHVRAGDTVQQGQVLCRLDDQDLILEQQKWSSELEQYNRKLREAMAQHELSGIQVISAQVAQAEAQLALTNEKISRAKITAPFDGVVISGDLSQLVGSPIELGKELFKIAPLESYRVILKIDEREVRHIQLNQQGKILISGISSDPLPFLISKITPVASAENGANFFRVEAQLAEAPTRIRPGMEGIGKISVGERGLWWILMHSFSDWLRLQLWNWLP